MAGRKCDKCGEVLVQKTSESFYNFKRRKSCGRSCHIDYTKHFHTMYRRGRPSECWEWIRGKSSYGYGLFAIRGEKRKVYAHRYAWFLATGVEPGKSWVLHSCDNPGCVNPSHLFLGSRKANIADMADKGRRAGELHARHKLTWNAVDVIRDSDLSSRDLALIYGVHKATVEQVRANKRWTNRKAWDERG